MSQTPSTTATQQQIKPAQLRTFHARLGQWYAQHGRHDLPWRNTSDPYHIWVSEVMLQQTQVATVRARFYHPFLEKFPTVEALASAPREAVMKAWEGLGYYRRAGFLHEAAKRAHNGLPVDVAGLLSLPGIGQNTAHAILAFAHHAKVPILEANVKRVVARIFALQHPRDPQLWVGAKILLDRNQPFNYNQAMMDLGSMICTPKAPRCDECPAKVICAGKAAPESYPAPKAKKKIPTRNMTILVQVDAAGRFYLEQRSDALLGGLWGFPQVSHESFVVSREREKTHDSRRTTNDVIAHVTHIYSHFRLEGEIYLIRSAEKQRGNTWFTREEIAALPLSKLDHKVLAEVDACNTGAANATSAGKARRRA